MIASASVTRAAVAVGQRERPADRRGAAGDLPVAAVGERVAGRAARARRQCRSRGPQRRRRRRGARRFGSWRAMWHAIRHRARVARQSGRRPLLPGSRQGGNGHAGCLHRRVHGGADVAARRRRGSRVGFAGDTAEHRHLSEASRPQRPRSPMSPRSGPTRCRGGCSGSSQGGPRHRARRAPHGPGAGALRDLGRRGRRAQLHLLARDVGGANPVPRAGPVTPERLADFDLVYLSAITLAILEPEARAALAEFLAGFRSGGGKVAFDSNYRPRLWPDVATARAEVARFWALTDVGLPSLDDELALYGEAGETDVLARLAAAGVARGALKRGAEGPRPLGPAGPLPPFAAGDAGGRHHGGRRQLQRRLPRRTAHGPARGRLPCRRARHGEPR